MIIVRTIPYVNASLNSVLNIRSTVFPSDYLNAFFNLKKRMGTWTLGTTFEINSC